MIEGLTLTDIINNVTGIGMLCLIAYVLFKKNTKHEEDIKKLKDEKFELMKMERDNYRSTQDNILKELVDAIKDIGSKI